jgi:hypothetical protein
MYKLTLPIWMSLTLISGYAQQKNELTVGAGFFLPSFQTPKGNTIINDTTYAFMSVLDDADIQLSLVYNRYLTRRLNLDLRVSGFVFSPVTELRIGQTLQTGSGPLVIYDTWGVSYSTLRLNTGVGVRFKLTPTLSINPGIGFGINIPTSKPFKGTSPGKFEDLANSVLDKYKPMVIQYQVGLAYQIKRVELSLNIIKSAENEMQNFSFGNSKYTLPSRLTIITVGLGYRFNW